MTRSYHSSVWLYAPLVTMAFSYHASAGMYAPFEPLYSVVKIHHNGWLLFVGQLTFPAVHGIDFKSPGVLLFFFLWRFFFPYRQRLQMLLKLKDCTFSQKGYLVKWAWQIFSQKGSLVKWAWQIFTQKGSLIKWAWQIFHRGFLVPNFSKKIIITKLGTKKPLLKYLPSPLTK